MEKKATVKDVAQKAGVSTATVSRVLNGDSRVKPETVDLVNQTIEELGYRLNRVARSLKTSRSHTVGVVAPEFSNEFFMSIVTGIEEKLNRAGYSVILCSSRESREEESRQIELLKDKGVDGIILIPKSDRGEHLVKAAPLPLVLVDRTVLNPIFDAVLADNYRGTFDAVTMALDDGARRIGFIGGDIHLSTARERFEGYKAAMKEKGLIPQQQDVLFGNYQEESGYRLMMELMEQPDSPGTFSFPIISCIWEPPGTFWRAAIPLTASISSPLTICPWLLFFPYSSIIVAQPMKEMGQRAAELLLRRIEGDKEDSPRTIRLDTTIRIVAAGEGDGPLTCSGNP